MNENSQNEKKKELKDLPREYYAVYNAIANAGTSITKDQLLIQLGQEAAYTRKLQEIVHSLIVDYDIPIGSSSKQHIKGYFIIENDVQRQEALRSLQSRVSKINNRINAIKHTNETGLRL